MAGERRTGSTLVAPGEIVWISYIDVVYRILNTTSRPVTVVYPEGAVTSWMQP